MRNAQLREREGVEAESRKLRLQLLGVIKIDDGEVRQCLRGPHLTADCAVPRKRHKRLDATGRGNRGANVIVAS